ncbi:MAG: hypothetical protein JRG89_01490 [Deltaproteobacteria bacterium]|nr:hypothetical protein [Deltaproteobacteria bacterium]
MSSNDRPSGRRSRKFRILLVLALIVGLIWIFGPGGAVHVAPGSTLVVELSGQYVEAATPTLLARGRPDRHGDPAYPRCRDRLGKGRGGSGLDRAVA